MNLLTISNTSEYKKKKSNILSTESNTSNLKKGGSDKTEIPLSNVLIDDTMKRLNNIEKRTLWMLGGKKNKLKKINDVSSNNSNTFDFTMSTLSRVPNTENDSNENSNTSSDKKNDKKNDEKNDEISSSESTTESSISFGENESDTEITPKKKSEIFTASD